MNFGEVGLLYTILTQFDPSMQHWSGRLMMMLMLMIMMNM